MDMQCCQRESRDQELQYDINFVEIGLKTAKKRVPEPNAPRPAFGVAR